jgi:hypothetical protein
MKLSVWTCQGTRILDIKFTCQSILWVELFLRMGDWYRILQSW